MKLEQAALTLVHYINVLAGQVGDGLSHEARDELARAVDAFREVDDMLEQSRTQRRAASAYQARLSLNPPNRSGR
jgi:hypothetical protein